jgi:hypothetical protein
MCRQFIYGPLLMSLWLVLAPFASGAEENAAKVYRAAFEIMPDKEKLTSAERQRLNDFQEAPLDNVTSDLLKKYAPALERLHQGAAMKRCDWELVPILKEKGVMGLTFPNHVQHARALAVAGLLRMRFWIDRGNPKSAFEDLIAVLTLARHAGMDGTMIGKLGAIAIENTALKHAAALLVNTKDATLVKELLKKFDKLPPSVSIAEVISTESEWLIAWMQGPGKAEIGKTIQNPDEDIAKLKKLCAEAARIAALPPDKIEAASVHLEKESATLGMLGPMVMRPAKFYRTEEMSRSYRQMFRAVLAILADGPDELQRFKDPHGTGPFTMRKHADGFELGATFKDGQGRNLKLSVGNAE